MQSRNSVWDVLLLVGLLAFVVWVPMPFGSTPDFAQPALIIPPLLLCGGAALARLGAGRELSLRRPARLWISGALLFIAVVALQLVPMPLPLLRVLSPESAHIWSAASNVVSLAGIEGASAFPITVDPSDTTLALFRLFAYLATFVASMFLVRGAGRRTALAIVVACTACFETLYAAREASLGRYAIWGWKNTLIFGRPSGTFVNPNHFAHHAAIALPACLFLCAAAWRRAGAPRMLLRHQIARLVETRMPLFAFGGLAAAACMVSIVMSQSRGAMLAVIAGLAATAALASTSRGAMLRAMLIAIAVGSLFVAVILVFGLSDAANRLLGAGMSSPGRVSAIITACRLWRQFPLFGCGLGTFENIALMVQPGDVATIANHAHNDYLEIAATAGIIGFAVSVIPLIAGYIALARITFNPATVDQSWSRRAFQIAALASLSTSMAHAFFDFNFFIPANPVTLAALVGAAVSSRDLPSR